MGKILGSMERTWGYSNSEASGHLWPSNAGRADVAGWQNVRPGPRRAEAAVVTCGTVAQWRGAGTRRVEPAGGARPGARVRRRDSTYLPGLGSGSAGRGAARALPPSFLLPPTPRPRPQRDTQYSPETEAAPRGSSQWKPGIGGRPRESLVVPAKGRRPEAGVEEMISVSSGVGAARELHSRCMMMKLPFNCVCISSGKEVLNTRKSRTKSLKK
ncbi:uncharacterized protein LOC118499938 [Phyllostomus discolor]|uniref:Uncharacterized protein LOC118499938 n=1 Tax=Phyllostomus discolor TaxID=89673 RepID=A0A7E6DHK2_9CHIR|nr:uncharacterized protein LOC118499938 [Phyllostomus discolor]